MGRTKQGEIMIIDPEKLKKDWLAWNEGAVHDSYGVEPSADFNAGYIAGWHASKKAHECTGCGCVKEIKNES